MQRFLVRRILSMILALWGVSLVAFFLIRVIPVDPVEAYFAINQIPASKESMDAIREKQGFNQPLLSQYANWMWHVFQLDFGKSFVSKLDVGKELISRFWITFGIASTALLFVVILSVTIGVLSAVKQNSLFDRLTRTSIFTIASMPSFWLAFILIYIVALKWGLLPLMGWGTWQHLILPSLTLALGISPYYIRLIRTSMIEQMQQPYVLYARARGLKENVIVRHHLFRGTLPPLLTSLAMTCGGLLGGAVIVEIVFTIPGIGRYILDSMGARDYVVLQGFILLIGFFYIAINFVADIMCAMIDPRIRLKGEGK
ncbi:nickel ABC transporter permease [Domibacillus mangrovi]|uniref:Nickel import system permease protein NikB n=1 Tax=Domibacillus mangrovi TaxID=1714354 RepID=A0A1Q5P3K5_9BACI|nr:nickel ABC transporter permease [Domibacillus mangrovi]OKL36753.1 nickel transporter permease [Domibacillus mangrovi]